MSEDRSRRARRATRATLPKEALGAPPGPRSVFLKVASGVLSGGLLVLLFAAIVPKLGDLDEVWASMEDMPWWVVALLVVAALVIRVLSCASYSILTPGLSLRRSYLAREVSAAVSNVVPGPSGTAAQFVVLRSYGVRTEEFVRATISAGVANNGIVFIAPGVFVLLWALAGAPEARDGGHAWLFGAIAVVVAAATIALVIGMASSERFAARVGALGQTMANPLRKLFGKEPVTTWPDRSVALRADTLIQLRAHGIAVLACVGGGYLLNALLLTWCMYAVGLSREQLPLALSLLLYSVARLATSVSITPGGVGVVEIVYTAVFVAALGEDTHNQVLAAVLVYRLLTYVLPIVAGAICYLIWRISRRHELHVEAEASTAAG